MGNQTSVIEFILLGLTRDAKLQAVLFPFLLLTYVLSIMGNLTIIILTLLDHRLQTPMYFFLRNFSVLEVSFTSVFVPKMLVSIGTGDKTISFAGCFTQYFFAILLGATEFYLLAAIFQILFFNPGPWQWKCWVLNIGPPGNCQDLIIIFKIYLLATPHGMWDFISLTRDWTHVPCLESAQS